MKITVAKSASIICIALALSTTMPAMAASNGSTKLNAEHLASSLNSQLNSKFATDTKAFGVWGALLDMGARANGTLKNGGQKHQAWCAKIHKSYDAQSNTYAQFNGKRRACVSPYG